MLARICEGRTGGEGKMSSRALMGIAVVLTLALSSTARARIIQVTYEGHVTAGTDHSAVFGTLNADLSGQAFRARFFFDTTLGFSQPGFGYAEDYRGGSDYGTTSPLVTSTFELAGVVLAMRGDSASELHGARQGDPGDPLPLVSNHYASAQYHYDSGGLPYVYVTERNSYEISNLVATLPPNFDAPLLYQIAPTDNALGLFTYYHYSVIGSVASEAFAEAMLRPETYIIGPDTRVPGPVPEPATWVMLLLGFCGVGTMARRHRSGLRPESGNRRPFAAGLGERS